jgi:glutamate carboxypeptidase
MIDQVKAGLREREAEMLSLLRELVLINSFTDNRAGGQTVGEILARELRAIDGMTVRSRSSDRFAPHWVAMSRAAEARSEGCIALVGHLDTVFPPGTFEGFRIEDGIAHGPGVLDMKGGLVMAIEVLRALAQAGALDGVPVRMVIVSDEEVGSPEGAPFIQEQLAGAAAALVLEAGRKGDAIITARKGTGSVRAVASGRAAHAGNAHREGCNAIWALARFIEGAQLLTDYARGITVNVGKISGGQGRNTVPDHAEALLDFRYVAPPDGTALQGDLARVAAAATRELPGTSIALEGGIARAPLARTEANVALYREYASAARLAGLGDGESPLLGGGSDASSTAAIGIPSIDGLGPRGSGFHTREERIEVATLVPKAEALARFLLQRRAS